MAPAHPRIRMRRSTSIDSRTSRHGRSHHPEALFHAGIATASGNALTAPFAAGARALAAAGNNVELAIVVAIATFGVTSVRSSPGSSAR